MYIGRLHPEKNPIRVVKQFEYFHKQFNSDAKLLLMGNGEMKDQIEEIIIELKLTDYIRVIPYMDNPFPYIRNAAALVLSSRHEGLPNVILEAMQLECLVIAVDCLSGPRELLNDWNDYEMHCAPIVLGKRGIIVSNSDDEDREKSHFMAEAMRIAIVDDEYVKTIKYNQRAYMNHYNNDLLASKWIDLIERKCEGKEYCNKDIISEKSTGRAHNIFLKSPFYVAGIFFCASNYFKVRFKRE